jgi:hypothetical protein
MGRAASKGWWHGRLLWAIGGYSRIRGLEGAMGSHRGKRVLQGHAESYRGLQETDY